MITTSDGMVWYDNGGGVGQSVKIILNSIVNQIIIRSDFAELSVRINTGLPKKEYRSDRNLVVAVC